MMKSYHNGVDEGGGFVVSEFVMCSAFVKTHMIFPAEIADFQITIRQNLLSLNKMLILFD